MVACRLHPPGEPRVSGRQENPAGGDLKHPAVRRAHARRRRTGQVDGCGHEGVCRDLGTGTDDVSAASAPASQKKQWGTSFRNRGERQKSRRCGPPPVRKPQSRARGLRPPPQPAPHHAHTHHPYSHRSRSGLLAQVPYRWDVDEPASSDSHRMKASASRRSASSRRLFSRASTSPG